jgi:ABC-type antimicrobial peptide transport system permease subunit
MSSFFRRNKLAFFGFLIVTFLTFVALLAPWLVPMTLRPRICRTGCKALPGIILLEMMS